jgi:UBA-like domain
MIHYKSETPLKFVKFSVKINFWLSYNKTIVNTNLLFNFQACTGIEDVGEAFSHLEAVQWDLLVSIYNLS